MSFLRVNVVVTQIVSITPRPAYIRKYETNPISDTLHPQATTLDLTHYHPSPIHYPTATLYAIPTLPRHATATQYATVYPTIPHAPPHPTTTTAWLRYLVALPFRSLWPNLTPWDHAPTSTRTR
ncbi:hypothetical protein JAAARDRAFT_430842 [Jaapia argillacea MUCL 33604]|uniref:Uncharacterized protein n=1 Tax=Jaapia argillacea MUCL 33604 TaxID=933084 RepID=A0A067PD25_9AGAM|nr:hypothetical protein JAAARDRAFT_430842 [Jaapia argillacea MUCL 33604]